MSENTLQITNNLKRCKDFIVQVEEKTSLYYQVTNKTVNLELEKDTLSKKIPSKGFRIFQMIGCSIGLTFMLSLILASNYQIADMIESTFGVYGGVAAIFILSFIISIIGVYFLVVGNYKNINKKIDKIDSEIKEGNELSNRIQAEISNLLKSEEGQFTANIVPPAYRKSRAINRFIYYFENGHVDTMKEAVKEYDQYIHNKKMENEAHRATVAAESAEIAAKQTAKSASDAAFWSLYNAYLNEK